MNNTPYLFIYVFLFFGLLGSSSCQETGWLENIEIVPDENAITAPSTHLKSLERINVLERRMQWTSYISARILCQDDEARVEVAEYLELQNSNVVSLDQLVVSSEHTPRFKTLFTEQVNDYILLIEGSPKPAHTKPIPPPTREGRMVNASDFIDFLTIDNCTELFFPNGLSTSGAEFYYSTAHPMTNAESNYGYELSCLHLSSSLEGRGSTEVVIDHTIVREGRTVIVTRPYRIEGSLECSYSDYDAIDFPHFLK